MRNGPDHTLEFLLAFDGRVHHLEDGYWIKFEICRVKATKRRPFGLSYSFTLHAPDGSRLVGFDNAHGVQLPDRDSSSGRKRVIIGTGRNAMPGDHTSSRMPTPCFRIFFARSAGF